MNFLKKLIPAFFVLGFSSSLFATSANGFQPAINSVSDVVNQKDLWCVRDWLKTKRVALNNKGGSLAIAGDVQAQWRYVNEYMGSINITGGPQSPSQFSNNLFNIDFRLYFDYKAERTWASVALEFDQASGTNYGNANSIALNRANMGYHLFDDGISRLDLLVGRQRLYDIYDSELQYNSTADGFVGTYAVSFESVADLLIHGGGYIVDARSDQSLWIVEGGIYDIFDTGLYVEYSWTDWHTSVADFNRQVNNVQWRYIINQFILGYVFNPELLGIDIRLFGGFLWNADAAVNDVVRLSRGKVQGSKQNLGGWIALQIGSVEKANDWAFQAQWQVLQLLGVPDYDVAGIGTGNSANSSLYFGAPFNASSPGNGYTNYNGFELDLLYALTNEVVMQFRFQRALSAQERIGFPINYTNVELSAIYGF